MALWVYLQTKYSQERDLQEPFCRTHLGEWLLQLRPSCWWQWGYSGDGRRWLEQNQQTRKYNLCVELGRSPTIVWRVAGGCPPVHGFCSGRASDRLSHALCCVFCHTFLQSSGLVVSHWLSCGEWWCYSANLKMPLWFALPQALHLDLGRFARIAFRGSIVNLELVTLIMWAFGSQYNPHSAFCKWWRVVHWFYGVFGCLVLVFFLFVSLVLTLPTLKKFIWSDLFLVLKLQLFILCEGNNAFQSYWVSLTSFPSTMAASQ